jgi:hypothetical protein
MFCVLGDSVEIRVLALGVVTSFCTESRRVTLTEGTEDILEVMKYLLYKSASEWKGRYVEAS